MDGTTVERELTEYERYFIAGLAEMVVLGIIIDSIDECLTGTGLDEFCVLPER